MVKTASIIILTFNRQEVIEKTVQAMTELDYQKTH
jgi:cellulose synthase/poly-beta-1,6-N-acetylglucosamine synthase-like glycosyltransferase